MENEIIISNEIKRSSQNILIYLRPMPGEIKTDECEIWYIENICHNKSHIFLLVIRVYFLYVWIQKLSQKLSQVFS